jgi:hypothetical protein
MTGTCHFCGGDTPCKCTAECRICRHIGHEHSADGHCRGTDYSITPFVEEFCYPHPFEPVSVRPS